MTMVVEISPLAPIPCRVRKPISSIRFADNPHSAEPTTKMLSAAR
jgi:hypothetical protein